MKIVVVTGFFICAFYSIESVAQKKYILMQIGIEPHNKKHLITGL